MRNGNSPVIVVERVSKTYWVNDRQRAVMQEMLLRAFGVKRTFAETRALQDVSFTVERGESIGIIGGNGAGKSTLLKILAGIAAPSSGNVMVRGKISSQLALGAGFHPYLTGRENLYLQGTVLGMRNAKIEEMFDRIVEYAGLERSIDRPLWTYSQGMIARLGFAVAAHVDFDLLLLDEALSAGDLVFHERCDKTLRGFREAGATLVIVSHGLSSVLDLCDRVIWLHDGKIRESGPADEVVDHYADASGAPKPKRKSAESNPENRPESHRDKSRLSV